MMTSIISRTSLGVTTLFLALTTPFAQATHPLITDDTGVQGAGNHQIELNTDELRDNTNREHVAAFTYTYGFHDMLDAYVTLPYHLSAPGGLTDVGVGMKWRIWEDGPTSIALKPELTFSTGDASRGLGAGRPNVSAALLVSHETGPWRFHGNIGLRTNRYSDQQLTDTEHALIWRVSAAALYKVSDKITLASDIGVARQNDKSLHTNPAYALIGVIMSPTEKIDIDVGFKRGLNNAETPRQVGVGLTVRF